MKHQKFKIKDATLFVYKTKKSSWLGSETDPTTSMATVTATSTVFAGRSK